MAASAGMRPFLRVGVCFPGAVIKAPQEGHGPLTAACEGGAESQMPQAVHWNFTGVVAEDMGKYLLVRHAEAFTLPPQQQADGVGFLGGDAFQNRARGDQRALDLKLGGGTVAIR